MELYQLVCFQTVAKYQNMTKAAQELYVSQSSLSKTIARLEKDVGVQLFDRMGSVIKLNGYGTELLKTADKVLSMVSGEKKFLTEMAKGEAGSVVVGSNINQFLDDLYEGFAAAYPNISLSVVSGSAEDMKQKLLARELDMIISTYNYGSQEIARIPLFAEPMGFVVSKENPLSRREEVKMSELREERFLINNALNDKNNHTFIACERAGFTPNVLFEGPLPKVCGSLVRQNRGIMIICKSRFYYMCKKHPKEFEGLVHVNIIEDGTTRESGVSFLKERMLTMAAESFLEYARSNFISATSGGYYKDK